MPHVNSWLILYLTITIKGSPIPTEKIKKKKKYCSDFKK